jgi:hypothetical protein
MEILMKTICSAAVVMSMAFGAAVAGVSQDRIPELTREGRTDPASATLTGCVARGMTTGTYTLTNAAKEGEAIAKDALQRLTVGLSSSDVDVSKHVGHKVSVTGSYARFEFVMGTAGTEKPAAADAIADGDRKTTRTFAVKSLKMIADSCSEPAE